MKSKFKIFLVIAVVLILGVGVFVFLKKFYFEPNLVNEPLATTTNTTPVGVENPITTNPNLKTYRNEEWGFEFEYPDGWSFHENTFYSSASKLNLIGASPEEGGNPNPINPSILINIVAKDFAEKAAMDRKNLGATISDILISGMSAIKYEYIEQIPKISVDVPQDPYHFVISGPKKYENVLNQILASFRFIEKYEINSQGELIKQLPSGKNIDLVTLNEMEGGFVVDNWSSDEDKIYPFVKGKVLEYWVSPDGNYIVYSVQDGLVSCCMAPPTGGQTG